jgi:hypothetical protein
MQRASTRAGGGALNPLWYGFGEYDGCAIFEARLRLTESKRSSAPGS